MNTQLSMDKYIWSELNFSAKPWTCTLHTLFSFLFFTLCILKINCINKLLILHIYKLSFANSASCSWVSAAREPISVAKKRQQFRNSREPRYIRVNIPFFLDRIFINNCVWIYIHLPSTIHSISQTTYQILSVFKQSWSLDNNIPN